MQESVRIRRRRGDMMADIVVEGDLERGDLRILWRDRMAEDGDGGRVRSAQGGIDRPA